MLVLGLLALGLTLRSVYTKMISNHLNEQFIQQVQASVGAKAFKSV